MNIIIEKATIKEVEESSILATKTYLEFNAKNDSKDGVKNVLKFMSIDNMRIRYFLDSNLLLVAKNDSKKIIGMIEVIRNNHISSLFIDKENIKKKVGTKLFEHTHYILKNNTYTVNSSIYALDFYKKLGFTQTTENIKIEYGVHFYPMIIHF